MKIKHILYFIGYMIIVVMFINIIWISINSWFKLPIIYFSQSTGKCVMVTIEDVEYPCDHNMDYSDDIEYPCNSLPEKYELIWVQ